MITARQFTILQRIKLIEPHWIGERDACVSKYMGRKLAKLGLIERKRSDGLPGSIILKLTESGRQMLKQNEHYL